MSQSTSVLAKVCLPHPHLTTYYLIRSGEEQLQIRMGSRSDNIGTPLPVILHNEQLFFTPLDVLNQEQHPPSSDNTLQARVLRAPETSLYWQGETAPTLAQFNGEGSEELQRRLKASTLGAEVSHPTESFESSTLIILRSTFWQGAASPLGTRSIWIPAGGASQNQDTIDHTITTKFSDVRVHTLHPRRAEKPAPGSIIYSRYIPSLDEHFSMVAMDYRDSQHLDLFHRWQNDPRVARGWNETGTLEQHRAYCRKLDEDPHILTVLARFQDEYFAYFEIYWGKEDHLGAYYDAQDFDRGRHSLVGEIKFRGKHRVTAWWSAIMHYILLDDPRTMRIVGEPKASNSSVLAYDFMHGFSMDKFVDLPHKRSALMICSRERFFQLCPLDHTGGFIGGTQIQLPAKL